MLVYAIVLYSLVLSTLINSPPLDGFGVIYAIGNRCSYLFIGTLPWIVALAGKHNIVSLLSGIAYQRLQVYHRSFSRMGLLLVLGHVVTNLKSSTNISMIWKKWGLVGFAAASVIWLIGSRNSLNWGYQVYVHVHVGLVALFLTAIWYHTKMVSLGPEVHRHLLVCFFFWGADRALRIIRIIWINALYRGRARSVSTYRMTILSERMMKVELFKTGLKRWPVGSHVFLWSPPFCGVSHFLEAHPFTIASIPTAGGFSGTSTMARTMTSMSRQSMLTSPSKAFAGQDSGNYELQQLASRPFASTTAGFMVEADNSGSASTAHLPLQPADKDHADGKLVFYIKRRHGSTQRLYEYARMANRPPLKLLVYGPFGAAHSYYASAESLILVAGGNGFSWTLPILLDACRMHRRSHRFLKKILWVWMVPTTRYLSWLQDDLTTAMATDFESISIDIRIHVTQEYANRRDPPKAWNEVLSVGRQRAPWIIHGRPFIPEILDYALQNANGRIWVGVCGPQSMTMTVRKAVQDLIEPAEVYRGNAKYDISLHCEEFGW